MKKLICILALLAFPILMMGQEPNGAKDIDKGELEGRPVSEKPITPALPSDCKEMGKVVFAIKVDREGVVKGVDITRGTTNATPCFVDYFKAIALATRFEAKADAPELQIGTITFELKPTE